MTALAILSTPMMLLTGCLTIKHVTIPCNFILCGAVCKS